MSDKILKWLECVQEQWRTPQEVLPEIMKIVNKCSGCKKDMSYCDNCERLLQT